MNEFSGLRCSYVGSGLRFHGMPQGFPEAKSAAASEVIRTALRVLPGSGTRLRWVPGSVNCRLPGFASQMVFRF